MPYYADLAVNIWLVNSPLEFMDTLFFILSKIGQFCIEPLNWVPIFILLALLFLSLRKPVLCKRLLILALLDLALVGYLPASEFFLRALENAVVKEDYAKLKQDQIGGIIILGGAIEGGEVAADLWSECGED